MEETTLDAPAAGVLASVLYTLCQRLDDSRYEELAELFSPDGKWFRQGVWLEGRAAIVQALQARPANRMTCHLLNNVHRESPASDEVRVLAYMTAYRGEAKDAAPAGPVEVPGPFSVSRLSARFVQERGLWRVAELRTVPAFQITGQ